jgi:hypothetical protein
MTLAAIIRRRAILGAEIRSDYRDEHWLKNSPFLASVVLVSLSNSVQNKCRYRRRIDITRR